MAMVAGAHFQSNLVHTRHPTMGLGLGQIASLVDDDLHPRRSVPPRAVTQEAATRVRAKPISMDELDESLMGVSKGNVQHSARSAFFPEEPAPQTYARPVRRALAGVTNTLCNTQNSGSTSAHVTSPKASLQSVHPCDSHSDLSSATRVCSDEAKLGGGSRAVHALSFPAARNMLWDHSPTAPVIHLSSNELAPTVRMEAAVGERLSKHFALMLRADRSPSDGELPSLHLRTLWACGEGVTLNLQEVKATDELQHGDRGYTPLRTLLSDGALHRTPIEAAFSPEATSNTTDMDALVQAFKQGCCQSGDLNLPNLLNISCVACPTTIEGAGAVLGRMVLPAASVRVVRLHPLRICDTALARSLKAAQQAPSPNPQSGYLTLDQARKLLPLLPSEPRAYDLPLVGVWVSGVSSPRHPLVWAALQRFLFNSNLKDKVFSQGAMMLQLYIHGHANPVCYDCIPSSVPTPSNQGAAFICYQFMAKIGGSGLSSAPVMCRFAAVHNSEDAPLLEPQPPQQPLLTPAHSPSQSVSMGAAPFPGQPPMPHTAPYRASGASDHPYVASHHFNAASPTSPAAGSYSMHWPGSFMHPQHFQAPAPMSPWGFAAGGSPQHAGTNSDNLIYEQQKQLLALQEQVRLLQNQLMSSTVDSPPQPASCQHPPPPPQCAYAGSHSNPAPSFPGTCSGSHLQSTPSSQVIPAASSPTSNSPPLLTPASWMQNLPAKYRPPPPLPNTESCYAHPYAFQQQQQQPEQHGQAMLKITHTHTSHTSTHTQLTATTASLGQVVLPATGLLATSNKNDTISDSCGGPTEHIDEVGPQVRGDQMRDSYDCHVPAAELQCTDTHKPETGAHTPSSDSVDVRAGIVVMQCSGRVEERALAAARAASKVTEEGVRRGLNLHNSLPEINPQSTLEDALEEAVLLKMPDPPGSPVGLEPEDLSPRRSLPSEIQPLPTGPMMEYPHPSFREILPTAGGKSSAQSMAQSSKTCEQTKPSIPTVPSVPEPHSDLPHVIFHSLSDEDCDSSDDEVELICQRYLNSARCA